MCMAQRKVTRLHVAYRATKVLGPVINELLAATCKNLLPVQVGSRLNDIQGKGVSYDK